MPHDPSFSFYEFKKWLSTQQTPDLRQNKQEQKETYGYTVKSRLGLERLELQLALHNPEVADIKTLARIFKENGGTLVDVKDLTAIVEVNSVKLVLPRSYTKI